MHLLLRWFIVWCCLLSIPAMAATPAAPQVLILRAQPLNVPGSPGLTQEEMQWLKSRPSLRLGVARDLPPLDISTHGGTFQGVSADVFAYLAHALGMKPQVLRYASRQQAIEALGRGELDLVSAVTPFELQLKTLRLSKPFLRDMPVMVGYDEPNPHKVRIGMRPLYHSPSLVREIFPEADLAYFDSVAKGLAALQARQIDLFMGDATGINYEANQNLVDDVRIIRRARWDSHWSFAMPAGEGKLQSAVDKVLGQLRQPQQLQLMQRWSGGAMFLQPYAFPIEFTPKEREWLKQHPVLRVAASHTLAPISFFDDQGVWRGATAELLELIAPRIGVRLEVRKSHSLENTLELMQRNQADLAVIPVSGNDHGNTLLLSEPVTPLSYNLVVRVNADAPRDVSDLRNKVIAVSRGLVSSMGWEKMLPGAIFKEVNNPVSAFDMVENGRADMALVATMNSRYYLPLLFNGKLREVNITGLPSNTLALAMQSDDVILHSIINKALYSIGPESLDNLFNERWRTNVGASNQSWYDYSLGLIYLVIAVASILLLVSLVWNSRLRKQIAKRQTAEKALNDQLNFMTTLIDVTPYPVYVLDRKGLLLSCNEHYLQALAMTREEAMSHRDDIGGMIDIDDKTRTTLAQDYQLAIEYGVPIQRDREVMLNKQHVSAFHWIQPFRDSEGVIRGVICGWIDISERRQLIEELQAAKEQADKASQAKTTFLATMSHEIRTPMSAVIGMLELALRQAEHGVVDQPSLQVAYDSAQGLLGLIGDILDIVRIESGHLSLNPEPCNLLEQANSVVRIFDGLARQKQLGLFLDVDPATAAQWQVMLDPLRFKQILSNLLSNAIKFTSQGSVTVRVRQSLLPDQQMLVQIRVTDTGIGISEEDQQRLFLPFGQARGVARNVHSGTGLGLVISRTLCEMMQGSLTLSSRPNDGTRLDIELRLPLSDQPYVEPRSQSAGMTHEQSDKLRLRILVVDDNAANRLLLSQQLRYLGHQTAVAQHGREGLMLWQQGNFDVVFTDCNMPEMNGYQLAQAIRQQEELEQRSPVLLLGFTANALPDEKGRCRAAGMDDCLFKPINLSGLRACLQQHMHGRIDPQETADRISYNLDELSFMEEEQLQQLLEHLLQGLRDDMETLQSLLLLGNAAGVARVAHQIKGAARIISANQVIDCCQALEDYCRQQEDISPQHPLIQPLNAAVADLQSVLIRQLGSPRPS
ncbi:hybrid sensory histidine kinase [Aquitalea magnusonii]|uniref:Virulence sensor protein BvgS n=1 Tax=Aquitalea magnusonii TaxID=332411 RepID=A0A3G9GGL7_9NEIS|nr:transporter substrate-binding domain-containing protein [Aquitalea magnusonii]BBF87010.1 hybrid sensory histidine kinase [Aquitalea magnusonii]